MARFGSTAPALITSKLRKLCAHCATKSPHLRFLSLRNASKRRHQMNGIIYLVGLVVVVLAILSFFGLR